jgi:serralysin
MDSLGDIVTENALEGTDTVRTGLAGLTLAANVERLVYVGTGNFSGTGNELNNLVTGGSGNDSLSGGLGADLLQGGDGNDTLEGGEGTDRLEGGAGDDTYIVSSAADLVKETDATGSDTGGNDTLRAQSADRYALALNVENFAFDGADGVTASGNAGGNLISGGSGNDTLAGGAGNDTLNGGAGVDRLSGGLDSDVFVFDTNPTSGADTITDFRSAEDKIQLDHAIFDKLGATGALNAEFFVEGKTALDANDFLVYDKAAGMLWYDADGSGDGIALQIALLSNKATVAASDFAVL